ncbi:MAG TPA: ATP-dependent DNA helicase RecG, partial [Phycisphaerales bacterium]|nr:ATP-dependent DNA helicase RecG [Phycisphaerales bacterium]
DSVIREILTDLALDHPMNRLLQGDVGSGKTAVALYAMLLAVARGHQSALMAPTELLAEQHFQAITQTLKGARVRFALLTGSLKPAERAAMLRRIAAGEIDIVVGTHALLNQTLKFKSLALAVIDEQHRFGVHQRAFLRSQSTHDDRTPHVLVMTATPIPRTLSLTLFGDLDVSTIRNLPPNRTPIITRHLPTARIDEAYAFVAERLDRGDQAYVVAPVIEESVRNLRAVQTLHRHLSEGPFSGKRIAAVHGRLNSMERIAIMDQFRAHKLDALVATSVIEVGVDVPNATIMVIEQADQFGLAQLHQLRGRVGRGDRQSLCLLIADPANPDAEARIKAMLETNDGFVIAERDLELRGPGELFGARQSGAAPFLLAEFPRDFDLLQLARRDAEAWIKRNPTLTGADDLLRKRLMKAYGKALGLADVA